MSQDAPNPENAPELQIAAPGQSIEETVGFNKALGFRLAEWGPSRAVMEVTLNEMHLNRAGVLHGGVLGTLIDAACGFSGVWTPPGAPIVKAMTLTLTTNYLGQVREGTVRAIATKKGGGRKIFFASAEVLSEDGTLLAMGEGSYRIRQSDPYGTPKS
jgi:uncharacterized protein (TIGR00369 family)